MRQCARARVSALPHIRLFVWLTFVGATRGSPSFARVCFGSYPREPGGQRRRDAASDAAEARLVYAALLQRAAHPPASESCDGGGRD